MPQVIVVNLGTNALDAMAASNESSATRVVSLDWGPGAPEAGMVSDTLAKLFAENGYDLVVAADEPVIVEVQPVRENWCRFLQPVRRPRRACARSGAGSREDEARRAPG